MTLLQQLQKAHRLFVRCPSCGDEFALSEGKLFDAAEPLPLRALEHITNEREILTKERLELKKRKLRAATKPAVGAMSSITGKVLEKIAPSLPGFPVRYADCRALFEPIDYVVFKGLAAKDQVDAILFVDVKSGTGRLGEDQRQIRKLVESKKVRLRVTPRGKEVS